MKKILFTLFAALFLMALPKEALASHAAGGEITYEYMGPNPNGAGHLYCVYLTIYRDDNGTTLPTSTTVNISSSCYSNQTITLARQSVTPPQDYTSCIDVSGPSNGGVPPISQNFYSNCNVVLPGNCNDWKFYWSLCCRNAAITNLQGASGYNLYLEANLNNTIGQNTSGTFINPAAKSFCVNRPFTWSQAAIEPDGDSIAFEIGQPLTAANTPIPYAAGYSNQNQMSTVNGLTLNARTGTFYFTPSNPEVDVIKILVKEYRYNTTFGIWVKIGDVFRELQIPIVAQCNIVAQEGITIDTTIAGSGGTSVGTTTISTDSIRDTYGITKIDMDSTAAAGGNYNITMPGIPYFCYDSVVTIEFSTKLKCSSFSPNGSEFRIIGPDKISRPVVGVDTKCGTDLLTDKVDLLLHKALDTNGLYLLYLKTGDDGDVLENECGFAINAFYCIMIKVEDCPILDYKLLNVTVVNDQDIQIDWEADNSTFSERLFDSWQILRANNDYQFYVHDRVENVYARNYVDTTLGAQLVDASPFQYAVQLVQNFKASAPTNVISSILLKQAPNGDSSTTFTWTQYSGFDNDSILDSVAYELEGGRIDASGNVAWANLWGPQSNLGVFSYNYSWPSIPKGDSAIYAYRVKATAPLAVPTNPFISESNWLYLVFKRPTDPPINFKDTVRIPNVFTPNNDGDNDLFSVYSGYAYVSISVYNRWGKLVFEDIKAPRENYASSSTGGTATGWDGRDMNSGNVLADGTYYYVITFHDDNAPKPREEKGHINIFTGGTR